MAVGRRVGSLEKISRCTVYTRGGARIIVQCAHGALVTICCPHGPCDAHAGVEVTLSTPAAPKQPSLRGRACTSHATDCAERACDTAAAV